MTAPAFEVDTTSRFPIIGGLELPVFAQLSNLAQPVNLAIQPTINQGLRPVRPQYLDCGPHDFRLSQLYQADHTHVSWAIAETVVAEHDQTEVARTITDTDRLHRPFGWEPPADQPLAHAIGQYILRLARNQLDWGEFSDHTLIASLELIKTHLPIAPESRYAYDEAIHTDAVTALRPVAQVFFATTRPTLASLSLCYIGEGSEALTSPAMDPAEPVNIIFGHNAGVITTQLPPGHLILADAKGLPHGRPDLSKPLEPRTWLGKLVTSLGLAPLLCDRLKKHFEDDTRYFLRVYIEPVIRPDEPIFTAMSLAQQYAYYGVTVDRPRLPLG